MESCDHMSLPTPPSFELAFTGEYRHPKMGEVYFWWDGGQWCGPFTREDEDTISWVNEGDHYAIYITHIAGPRVFLKLDKWEANAERRGQRVD